uniref:tyrosine-type recombinase/integrase n=1 Tax=Dokdonella sp. TaxID=2291710 RepID=UPI002D1FA3E4
AQEYHDKRRAELWEQQRLGVKPRRSWDEAVLRYLGEEVKKKSVNDDKLHLRWWQPRLESMELPQITRDVVDRYKQESQRSGLSDATTNRRLQVLRAILRRAALEWEWLDRLPRFRLLKEPQGRVRYLTREEAGRLLAELPGHLQAMVRFSLATGLRQANVKGLRWAKVDIDRRCAWVDASEAKGKRAIPVPLNAEAMHVIEEQRGRHPEWVFTYRDRPIEFKTSTKAWRKALVRAGIENFRWHDLRHTWASWHAQSGTPMHVLQKLGGWQTPAMVQRYAHLGMDDLKRYAEQVRMEELTTGYDFATSEKQSGPEGPLKTLKYLAPEAGLEPATP